MSNHYPVAVIGGGASGLFFGSLNADALVLEKGAKAGMKLLVTGGGACNFTHRGSAQDISEHFYDKRNFTLPCLSAFPPKQIISYFSALRVEAVERDGGKLFPSSGKAEEIRLALVRANHHLVTNAEVLAVKKDRDVFCIHATTGDYTASRLVIATGGKSYPQTGSSGFGSLLAKQLGHTIIPERAALCPINLDMDTSSLEGISLPAVTITVSGHQFRGDLIFTRKGISGPAAMNAAHYAGENGCINIRFASFDKERLKALPGKMQVKQGIKELTGLPSRFISEFLWKEDTRIGDITRAQLQMITHRLMDFEVKCNTTGQLATATITRGGCQHQGSGPENLRIPYLPPSLYHRGDARC